MRQTDPCYLAFLQQTADRIIGWRFTVEYPGFLSHFQEVGTDDELDIRMGFDAVNGTTWQAQYFRDAGARCTGGWDIENAPENPAELAEMITFWLNTSEAETDEYLSPLSNDAVREQWLQYKKGEPV